MVAVLLAPKNAGAIPAPPDLGVPHLTVEGGSAPLPVAYLGGDVHLVCSESAPTALDCQLSAIHRYKSLASGPLRVRLSPNEPSLKAARYTFDGQPAPASRGYRREHELVFQPGRVHVFETKATVRLAARYGFLAIPALQARHLVFGDFPERNASIVLRTAPPQRNLAETGEARLSVTIPDGWIIEGRGGRMLANIIDSTEGGELLQFQHQSSFDLYNGGPLLGLGAALGNGFRARFGYEIGLYDWLWIAGLDADFDFKGVAVFAPRIEAALPQLAIIPSLAAGVGAPVRIERDAQVGGRLQLTASIFASFVTSIDYFPRDDLWEVTMLGVLGF